MKIRTIDFIAVVFLSITATQAFAGWNDPVPVTVANSSYHEWYPIMTDDTHLYFSRSSSEGYRIFMASRPNEGSNFNSVQQVLSGSGNLIAGWVSPDNLRMYYHQEYGDWSIKISERASVNDPWSQGRTLNELSSVSSLLTCPRLTPDELTMVFVSRQPDGSNTDLYMATRANRSSAFGNIHPLSEIDTLFHENSPSLTGDGLALYFLSNRTGVNQTYKATRNSIAEQFGNIEMMPFNGMGQPFISPDGKTFCFASSYNSASADLYISTIPEPATMAILGLGGLLLRRRTR